MTLMQSLQNAIWSQLPTRFFETVKANLSKNVSDTEIRIANYLHKISFIPISYNLEIRQIVHGRAVIYRHAFVEDYYDICYGYLYSVIEDEQYRMWFRNNSIRFGSTMFKFGMDVAKGNSTPQNTIKTWRVVDNVDCEVVMTGITEPIRLKGSGSLTTKLHTIATMTNFLAMHNFARHNKELEGLMPTLNAIVGDHNHIAKVAKHQGVSNGSVRFASKHLFKEAFTKGTSVNADLMNQEQKGLLDYHGMLGHFVVPIYCTNGKAKIKSTIVARLHDNDDFFSLCSGYFMGHLLSKGSFTKGSGFYNAITEYLPCDSSSRMFNHGIELFNHKVPPLNQLTVSVVGKDVCINVEEESVILVPIKDPFDQTIWDNARKGIISSISYDSVDHIRNNPMGINQTYSRLNAIITDKMVQLLGSLGIERPPKYKLSYTTIPSGQELVEMYGTAGMLPIDMTADVFYHPESKPDVEPITGLEWV